VAKAQVAGLFDGHPDDPGGYLRGLTEVQRTSLMAWSAMLYELGTRPRPGFDAKAEVADWVAELIGRHPKWLTLRRWVDPVQQPWVPGFRNHFHIIQREVLTQAGMTREAIADLAGLTGDIRALYLTHGLSLIDNGYFTDADVERIRILRDHHPAHLPHYAYIWVGSLQGGYFPWMNGLVGTDFQPVHVGERVDSFFAADDQPFESDFFLRIHAAQPIWPAGVWLGSSGLTARLDALRAASSRAAMTGGWAGSWLICMRPAWSTPRTPSNRRSVGCSRRVGRNPWPSSSRGWISSRGWARWRLARCSGRTEPWSPTPLP
jgi:hypothetical protein